MSNNILLRAPIIDENVDIHCLSFSPDGQTIAVGCGDGTLRLYNTASGRRHFRMQPQPIEDNIVKYMPITACCYKPVSSPDDPQIVLACSSYGQIMHFHAYRGTLLHQFTIKDDNGQNIESYCLKYSPDGSQYAIAGKDGRVRIYDESTNHLMCELKGGNDVTTVGHSNRVFSLVFHDKDPNILFSAGWDMTLQVWDVRAGHSIASIYGCRVCGDSLDFKNDTLLVGNYNCEDQIRTYDMRDLKNPKPLKAVSFYAKTVNTVVEEFDEKLMEKLNKIQATTQVHEEDDIPEPKVENELPVQNYPQTSNTVEVYIEPTLVYDAKFARPGADICFASGSGGRELRIYDLKSEVPKMLGCWQAPGSVFACASSPDGRFGAIAGAQFGIQVFSLEPYAVPKQ